MHVRCVCVCVCVCDESVAGEVLVRTSLMEGFVEEGPIYLV